MILTLSHYIFVSWTKFWYDYVIQRMDKIDHSIFELKSKLREFRKAIMGFIGSYNDDTSKQSYDNSPIGRSYMVSRFNV